MGESKTKMEEFCGESVSLVSMFDDLMKKQEEARVERNQTGPDFFLKVLHTTALAEARETERVKEAEDHILLLEKEIEILQSREVSSQQLSAQQQQQILQLEEKVLAMETISEQLAAARQQVFQLEESLRKSELESEGKSKVIDLLKAEVLSLKMVQEDRMNHNTISVSDHDQALTANLTDDISIPTEDCFTGRNAADSSRKFVASTPAPRILPGKFQKRRSMSLDININLVKTPIIPGRCKQCASRPLVSQAGADSLDSPQLPWCTHGSDGSGQGLYTSPSVAAPIMGRGGMLPRGALKAVAPNQRKKILL